MHLKLEPKMLRGFTPEVQFYEPLLTVTGIAEFYFSTLSTTT